MITDEHVFWQGAGEAGGQEGPLPGSAGVQLHAPRQERPEFHSSGRRAGMAGGAGDRCPRTAGLGGVRSPGRPPPSKGARERALGNSERRSHSQAQGTERTAEAAGAAAPPLERQEGHERLPCRCLVSQGARQTRPGQGQGQGVRPGGAGQGLGFGVGGGAGGQTRPPTATARDSSAPPRLKAASPAREGGAGAMRRCGRWPAGATRAAGPPAEPSRARARCWHPRAAAASPPAR